MSLEISPNSKLEVKYLPTDFFDGIFKQQLRIKLKEYVPNGHSIDENLVDIKMKQINNKNKIKKRISGRFGSVLWKKKIDNICGMGLGDASKRSKKEKKVNPSEHEMSEQSKKRSEETISHITDNITIVNINGSDDINTTYIPTGSVHIHPFQGLAVLLKVFFLFVCSSRVSKRIKSN
ncbi:hypothetical protein RFI_12171 [Reticulomyxa filosa]|uniref:Uncharacterized protein n=1 Tax=Reticulomyxa filosa TaxID=46433 RepID=X6NG74_RETFI|nr:hypothetical protein RFI_12171 [Reticulomyxa filosa]|eukprot:ETO24976.1 hypothetical protein RFI_12171 [Reticulomyxa filosa]